MAFKGICIMNNYADFSDISINNKMFTDITNKFVWTDNNSVLAGSGLEWDGTTIMKVSNFVDVEGASVLKLKFMKWTSSTGKQASYGLAFYNSSGEFINGLAFPLADSSFGYSNGESYNLYINIPSNAKYIKTTYHKDTATYGEFSAGLKFV